MATEEYGNPDRPSVGEAEATDADTADSGTGAAPGVQDTASATHASDESGADEPEANPAAVDDAEAGANAEDPAPEAPQDDDAPADSAEPAAELPETADVEAAHGPDGGSESIKRILEAALLVAGRPLSINDFEKLFGGSAEAPPRNTIRGALAELAEDWQGRSLALQEVATGYRAQVRTEFEPWIARLWDEKPPRYSRALLETLAIIAYRQPMTRSEIEDIRGVSVSSQIIRTLTEREWIRVVGHREAPGRPAMYGTTREFLDYFNLKTLDQLPPISDIKDLEGQYPELGFDAEPAARSGAGEGTGEAGAETDGASAAGAEDAESADAVETDAPAEDDAGAGAGSEPDADARSPDEAHPSTDDDAGSGDDDAGEAPCTPAS